MGITKGYNFSENNEKGRKTMKTTKKLMKCLSAGALMFMGILSMGNVASAEEMKISEFKDAAVRQAVMEKCFPSYDEDEDYEEDADFEVIETDDIKELYIGFEHGIVKDLSGIEKLTKLEEIDICQFAGSTASFYQTSLKSVSIGESEAATVSMDAPYITSFRFSGTGTVKLNMNIPKVTSLSLYGSKLVSLEGLTKSIQAQLTEYYLYDTGLCTCVDVSNMVNLNTLGLSGEKINQIKGLNNLTKLVNVFIRDTKLTKLDFSKHNKLKFLICENNRLTSLKLPKSLEDLYCYGNRLTKLDVNKCKNLRCLYAGKNKLKSINIKKNKKLVEVSLSGNKNLKSLNVTQNKKLSALYCSNTKISSLNLKNNKKLRQISYYGSKIKKLDLTGYKNLTILYAAKKGQTVSLKNFLGTGYKCTQKPTNVTYSKNKNSIKVKKAFYFDGNTVELKKGKRIYHIRMIPNKADSIDYWELRFLP